MTVAELLAGVAKEGGYLTVEEGRVRYHGPKASIEDRRDEIRSRKTEIIAWLQTPAKDQPVEDLVALDYAPDCEFLVRPKEGAAP